MRIEWKRVLTWPALLAAVLLLAGAFGLETVKAQLGVVLRKQPIPLRRELELLNDRFRGYELTSAETMSRDIESSLGTPHYISWVFHDTRLPPDTEGAAVRLHVAYYTGTADTIPHVPELCYVASGVEAVDSRQIEVELEPAGLEQGADGETTVRTAGGQRVHLPAREVPMHLFTFRPRGGPQTASVFYFFLANGRLFGSKRGVRLSAINIRDRYAYYCKIELMPGYLRPHPETGKPVFAGGMNDPQAAIETVRQFLGAALPEILLCLPDWHEVRQGVYPASP
jgi:hypothetical protein